MFGFSSEGPLGYAGEGRKVGTDDFQGSAVSEMWRGPFAEDGVGAVRCKHEAGEVVHLSVHSENAEQISVCRYCRCLFVDER